MSELSGRQQATMGYFVFARIRGHYLLLGDQDPEMLTAANSLLFSARSMLPIMHSKTCTGELLAKTFGQQLNFDQSRYAVSHDNDCLLLVPLTSFNRSMFRRHQFSVEKTEARQRVTEFRLATKAKLIHDLYATETSLGEYVRSWADYFFSDHYSLWIYNRYTESFTCSTSSFDYPRNFIFTSENSSLNRTLAENYEPECRAPNEDRVNLNETRDVKTINRLKLSLGYDGTIGVLTFYSRHDEFSLTEENQREVRHSIETKYLQVRQEAHQSVDQINLQFIENYSAGQLHEFLYAITRQVNARLQVEACSIFLANEANSHLDLIASCDNQLHGEPGYDYSYLIDGDSPTVKVFCTGEMAFSYDLATDDPNNDGYNESTDHSPRNWIGAPITCDGQRFGVLRVRNKYEMDPQGNKLIINFTTADFSNLLSLCSNLANVCRIESLFNEVKAKQKATNESIKEMNDFNKVFLHEIRTPISKFTMAPEIIKRTLRNKQLTESNLEKVMKQLDDIQVMGDRLEFIAKTFNFNQIVTRRNFETLSVLRDIIFPVINITRPYLRKQYDIDIQLDATGLQSCRVYADKTLLNIVFNTLIDNAGKYSIGTRKPISVSGGYGPDGEFFDIIVSNYGLAIHEDEIDKLYQNGERGREAIKHGIGGTGIGLHLAHRIMTEGNGELLLTSIKDPVSFTIRIPVRPPGNQP